MINQDENKIRDRWRQFWARENHDTPLLSFTALKSGISAHHREDLDDPECFIKSAREKMERTYYGGDAYPSLSPELMPELTLGICGFSFIQSPYGYSLSEKAEDLTVLPPLVFDEKSQWWKKLCDLTDCILSDARGDYLVELPNLYAANDLLSALRSPENLCYDLLDFPEEVQKRTEELITINTEIFTRIGEKIKVVQTGAANWMKVFQPDGGLTFSGSDFSCLVGEEEFKTLLLPGIKTELQTEQTSIYHLDGAACLHHLDALLTVENLTGIQWVPGEAGLDRWLASCRRIQKAGLTLQIECRAEELKPLCETLSPEGLHLVFHAADESDAKSALKLVEETYRAKKRS